jgi:hypothetical protein
MTDEQVVTVSADVLTGVADHDARLGAGVSQAGRPVRVTVVCSGVEPFYVVTYARVARATRFTPFLERARHLVACFLADETDPAVLAGGPRGTTRLRRVQGAVRVISTGPRAQIPGSGDSPSADPPKQRGFDTGLYDARTGPRRGGRPRRHATRQAAQAAASRAYRARRAVPG